MGKKKKKGIRKLKIAMRFEADTKPVVIPLLALGKADKAAPVVRVSETDWFCSFRHD